MQHGYAHPGMSVWTARCVSLCMGPPGFPTVVNITMGRDYDTTASYAEGSPLLGAPSAVFVPAGRRQRTDKTWTYVWIAFYLATVATGVYAFLHR